MPAITQLANSRNKASKNDVPLSAEPHEVHYLEPGGPRRATPTGTSSTASGSSGGFIVSDYQQYQPPSYAHRAAGRKCDVRRTCFLRGTLLSSEPQTEHQRVGGCRENVCRRPGQSPQTNSMVFTIPYISTVLRRFSLPRSQRTKKAKWRGSLASGAP